MVDRDEDEWDQAKKKAESKGSGIFVRLENDKDKVIGAFCGKPHVHELFWNGTQYEPYLPKHKEEGQPSSPRFALNIYVIPGGEKEKKDAAAPGMKIIEMNASTFKDIVKVRDKYGFEKYFFEIERQGKKGDTKTTYAVLPDREISAEERKQIAAAPLHDLAKSVARSSDEDSEKTDLDSHDKKAANGKATASSAGSSETISSDAATALVGRLKVLPKDALDRFLSKFSVKKVRELKGSDVANAIAFVDELEGKKSAEQEEVDPFA